MRDQMSRIKAVQGFAPVVLTNVDTAQVTGLIDRLGFDALTFVINLGALTDAGCSYAVTMTHGDAAGGGDQAAVAATDLVGTLAAIAGDQADDNKTLKIGYVGIKRYVKLTFTPTGNAAGAIPVSCVAILGCANTEPQSTQKV